MNRIAQISFIFFTLLLLVGGQIAVPSAQAQDGFFGEMALGDGEKANAKEAELWGMIVAQRYIKARTATQKYLKANPKSFVARLALATALYRSDADFPRANREILRGLEAIAPYLRRERENYWKWHSHLLRLHFDVQVGLEEHEDALETADLFDSQYEPKLNAERSWPLMKLKRYDDARAMINKAIESGNAYQRIYANTSLCALEFEAGNDQKSYEVCRHAMQDSKELLGASDAVEYTNFAEACRSLFRFDESERTLNEALEQQVSWYGNPWRELTSLYLRQGRFFESWQAAQNINPYRRRRPPQTQESDASEVRSAIASFLLVVGQYEQAFKRTQAAVNQPDRHGHNSRDINQDKGLAALLHRRVLLSQVERAAEDAAAKPFYTRAWIWLSSLDKRIDAWRFGRMARRLLGDEKRLVGIFQIGRATSAVTPPWLIGELSELFSPSTLERAISLARQQDTRAGSDAYYDAFIAEVAYRQGDVATLRRLVTELSADLSKSEALLMARLRAMLATSLEDIGDDARADYQFVLERDPSVLRRLGLELPVHFRSDGSDFGDELVDALENSPRFKAGDIGTVLVAPAAGSICLSVDSVKIGCAPEPRDEAPEGETLAPLKERWVSAFHQVVFAPRLDLSQGDINGLDGGGGQFRAGDEWLSIPSE